MSGGKSCYFIYCWFRGDLNDILLNLQIKDFYNLGDGARSFKMCHFINESLLYDKHPELSPNHVGETTKLKLNDDLLIL